MGAAIVLAGSYLVLGLSMACGTESTPPVGPLRITEAESGRTVEMRVGGELIVTLDGNPTTGFRWDVKSGDVSVIRLSGEPEFLSPGGAPGAAGEVVLRFGAIEKGQTTLTLIYHRPFESGTPPERVFAVTVEVR